MIFVQWSRRRNAISPVPPAMSSIFQPSEGEEEEEEEPGLMERTKWSFHRRWMPRDMKSFMVSYEVATLLNTPATGDAVSMVDPEKEVGGLPRASFSASATVSNPK